MKTIKLTEGQMSLLNALLESESAPDFNDGDIKEFGDPSENSTVPASISDDDGNPKYAEMPNTNKISKSLANQNYYMSNGARLTGYYH